MEKTFPMPNFDGYWFIEISRKHGELLVCRVNAADWFLELGNLQLVDSSPHLHTCEVAGKTHVALSLTVGDYGPGYPTWCRHIERNPDYPIETAWFDGTGKMEALQ